MNKLSRKLIIIGVILITTSITLISCNNYEEEKAALNSSNVLESIKTNISEEENKTIINYQNKEMETINISGYDYIGTIAIPSLNLELPIMSEYDNDRLKIAPCRYYGSLYTNDLIICAHSYKTHFKYLSNLNQLDKIIITDIHGNNHIYEVLEIEILNPKEVSKMINNDFDLTLYTCTNDGLNRITVRCNRVSSSI